MSYPEKEGHQGPKQLGLSNEARDKLQALTGIKPQAFYAPVSVESTWRRTANPAALADRQVMFIGSTWTAEIEGIDRPTFLHLADGIWLDLDDKHDLQTAIEDCQETAKRLQALDIELDQCNLFASGGKGFHIFVPLALLIPGGVAVVGKVTITHFPHIAKEFVMETLYTASTDMSIYSAGKGKLFRQPGEQRDNNLFKVPMTWGELRGLNACTYQDLCKAPRPTITALPVTQHAEKAAQAWHAALHTVCTRKQRQQRKPATAPTTADLRNAVDALRKQDPDSLSYADWFRVGAALKSTGHPAAFELWEAWSKQGKKYRTGDCSRRWEGLHGGVTLGTLFYIVKQQGATA